MLRGIRQVGQSAVGKVIATILFVLLIGSFAVFGISDVFRTTSPTTVARVGKTDIGVEQFRVAYNNELQRLGRQFRTTLTPDQARMLGIDQRVAANLITQAVLGEEARRIGLSASDQLVVRSIMDEPAFKGGDGQFNRALFEQVLSSNGLSEQSFVNEQRGALTRTQLADALVGELTVPTPARDAMHRFTAERRGATYFVLTPATAGEIPAPTQEQVQAFYNDRKSSFMAPEYRAVTVLSLDAAAIAKADTVTDADALARYEQDKSKFGTAEQRTIQQITFPAAEDAEAASNKIKSGATFDQVATERNVPASELELGTFTRAQMLDPAVAEAAFALPSNGVSGPVAGRFGPVIVRVTNIVPEQVKPFDEVAAQIRSEMAQQKAQGEIESLHDQIEDMRASARPLADIAKEKGLTLLQVPAVNKQGLDKAGNPVMLPAKDAVITAAFASDVGVDNEALRSPGGYVWYDVTGIEPPREKSLDEVRDEVVRQWRDDEVASRLVEKARAVTERLEKGDTIETLAQENGATVKTATDLARRTAKDDLSDEAVTRIFSTFVGKGGNAATTGGNRAVFKVTSATVPPMMTTTQEAQRINDQLKAGMSDDLIGEYVAQLRNDLGVTLNQQVMRQVTGGGEY
jgi:peptidyl-prolyl cis-trans isomerase D